MRTTILKWGLPFVALGIGIVGFVGINAIAQEPEKKEIVDTRPVVKVEAVAANDHQVMINSYGEVKPLENTQLSAQVSGEVVSWHPNFVAGGIVGRGEVLFTIEKDNYEAAVLQAEAELARAQAMLIEEQAQAKVAEDEAKRFPSKARTDLFLRKPQVLSAQASVKSAQAGLKRAQRDLDNCEVTAPYDALVINRNVGVGQFVSMGAQVAELNNIETAEVIIPIAGFDSVFLPERVKGVTATVIKTGLNGFTRQAVIDRDLGIVDNATRMSSLVVRIDDPYGLVNKQPAIKFGTYVQVNFAGTMLNNIYRLPQELVNNQMVWIVNDEQQLEPRKVKVIREEGEFFYISDGLEADDQLVVTLPEYPQKGMAVKIAGLQDAKEIEAPKSASTEQL
ncbi:MAG: multidrug efflux system membrane fusion protein [Pseudoalteromonas rhizosphaerae]|jgi:multidrug efflux system membrane fusion protein|uniref:Efflux RND transporter periplasmic adaptor subunit n=1 Tax=Pseudoalteromonas neustonica TaxID=1840331 RepID=A0ABY3FAZ6_9GAMM|nr:MULTISPECIES: efflux RND transporter periplasmic adaptor subunit [Pseudoalteromonas]MBB1292359.1 efflux RND transporter periplasmic adaptor subunit [Pseudoalteromonas sp. SR41-4]MBB1299937.1 efflux RND transporter periplasmic adaptor subunit [Pseudoalteromonas sp. SR44-8]MBB1309126.1 efflux RND transporter periplasmic adaptor subunit [Pseudoalteromonas sp. SR41-8]MBB1397903.1 efflux RND transporter periplasmic adaptor subunit [Pseudoalteromonas sp. SG44-8]MBB1410555.1 efflux RND transporter|tara:strand:+ start:6140 stop:7318 length:1179 start_codon:yes stop_codon:yes gene_type:complete